MQVSYWKVAKMVALLAELMVLMLAPKEVEWTVVVKAAWKVGRLASVLVAK